MVRRENLRQSEAQFTPYGLCPAWIETPSDLVIESRPQVFYSNTFPAGEALLISPAAFLLEALPFCHPTPHSPVLMMFERILKAV